MATETGAAALAAEGASAGLGAVSYAGAAIKAFVLSNPVSLAGVAGVAVGVLGYHLLFDRGETGEAASENQEATSESDAPEASPA
jgi:hypothetical protein